MGEGRRPSLLCTRMFMDNYAKQAKQAQAHFLTYDQAALIKKGNLPHDGEYLYPTLFRQTYRLNRTTGILQRKQDDGWVEAGFNEIMTILDIICDSRPDRSITGKWNSMQNFGLQFHQNLLEMEKDPFAERFDRDPEAFHRACRALGGETISGGDIGYAIEVMEDLKIALQFWHSDEDFPAQVRFFWDENALQYIRYETMYFAVGRLKSLLLAFAML